MGNSHSSELQLLWEMEELMKVFKQLIEHEHKFSQERKNYRRYKKGRRERKDRVVNITLPLPSIAI